MQTELNKEVPAKKKLQTGLHRKVASRKQLETEVDEGAKNLESMLEQQEDSRNESEETMKGVAKLKRHLFENDAEVCGWDNMGRGECGEGTS